MTDLILQWIFLPVTIVMFGLEAVGKAIDTRRTSAETDTANTSPTVQATSPAGNPSQAPAAAASANTKPEPARTNETSQGPDGVKPVAYHPNAQKGCCG